MFRMGGEKDEVNDWEKLVAYRRGMEISRWHTCQPVFQETVGHHTANVALLVHYLTDGEASKELLYSALIHDIGEFYTGDLPAPAKRDNPELATRIHDLDYAYLGQQNIEAPLLPESEKNLLRAADILDLIFTSRLEIQIGNDSFHEVFWRGIEYIAMVHLPTKAQARVNQIVDKLKENVSERE